MTTFNKLNNATSLARQATHQDVDSKKHFSLSSGNSTKWRPFLHKEGGLIQVDISGDPPIPIGPKQPFGNLLFLVVFWFLTFWGHFEGIKEFILGSST
jgi:hypothetical protein